MPDNKEAYETIRELEQDLDEKEKWKDQLEEEGLASDHYLLCLRQLIVARRDLLQQLRTSIKKKEKERSG